VRLVSERPRTLHEDLPHRQRGDGEEVRLVGKLARAKKAEKRGGAPQRITLDDRNLDGAHLPPAIDVLALDEALTRLEAQDADMARIVELRYFVGLTVEETAEVLESSPATVKRHWAMARAWLKQALDSDVHASE
jgi:RNA polymerase sigma factor (TIGR02999 family)